MRYRILYTLPDGRFFHTSLELNISHEAEKLCVMLNHAEISGKRWIFEEVGESPSTGLPSGPQPKMNVSPNSPKSLIDMVGDEGLEPPTN